MGEKVTVQRYRLWDGAKDEYFYSTRYATPEWIAWLKVAEPIGQTFEIDASDLEPGEKFTPRDYMLRRV